MPPRPGACPCAEPHRCLPDRVRVLTDTNWPKNKPKALNVALTDCSGEITGVFDAEDEVHLDILSRINACFEAEGVDVVQGGVQLMNFRTSWWVLHNVLEYFFWFKSRLHYHANRRFIPLGGNTVFARTDLIREAGGWDDNYLAEDCEIGVRLSSMGAGVSVAYDPELVTREETPPTLGALVRQRTRWDQGFIQVLRKGEWRRLPTFQQRLFARYTLAMPMLQAFVGVLIPFSVVAVVALHLPVVIALASYLPLLPTIANVMAQAVDLSEFCSSYGYRARIRDFVRLIVGTIPYQIILGYAALRAVVREATGDRSWEKTAHLGAHRNELPAPPMSCEERVPAHAATLETLG